MSAAQNLKVGFNITAIDQEKVENIIREAVEPLGFRLVLSGGGPIKERDMLFERDLTNTPD